MKKQRREHGMVIHFAASRLGVTVATLVGSHTPRPDSHTQQFPLATISDSTKPAM